MSDSEHLIPDNEATDGPVDDREIGDDRGDPAERPLADADSSLDQLPVIGDPDGVDGDSDGAPQIP